MGKKITLFFLLGLIISGYVYAKPPVVLEPDQVSSLPVGQIAEQTEITNRFFVLVFDLKTKNLLVDYDPTGWSRERVPLGSLIKPFTIIARSRNKPLDVLETHDCRGYNDETPETEQCYLRAGHGKISLIPAIAYSCNYYFYEFSKKLDFKLFLQVLREWGVIDSKENLSKQYLNATDQAFAKIGKMNILRIVPIDMARSYVKLMSGEGKLPVEVREAIGDGMRESYRMGTASEGREKLFLSPDLPVFCKTGTGVYEEDGEADIRKTNGFFVGVYADRYLVFTGVERTVGSGLASVLGLTVIKHLIQDKKPEVDNEKL